MFKQSVCGVALLFSSLVAPAEVRLPKLFSTHAVLQRDRPVRVFGFGSPGEKVTVQFHGQTVTATTDKSGWWETTLQPEKAGGPYTLTVSGSATAKPIESTDILVGDVWFASGQSNMEMPLAGFGAKLPVNNGEKEIAAATHPQIRLLRQKRTTSPVPTYDSSDPWTECVPETARPFSAVAYFFGREISEREHVAVGLIDSTWGGMPTQAFTSMGALAKAGLMEAFVDAEEGARAQGVSAMLRDQQAYEKSLKAAGGTPASAPAPRLETWVPGALYNGMVAPFTHYTIKGAIWYQGEADRSIAHIAYYRREFPVMIQDWRARWRQGNFPFLLVQLPSFDYDNDRWPTVRDAQRNALRLTNTAMAVTLDTGEAKNIHPPDKQTVGARLALAARERVYGEKIEGTSPTYERATTENNAMRVWLSHADALRMQGDAANGFEVAGEDHIFHAATAKIDLVGKDVTILAASPAVAAPRFVRYAWQGWVTTWFYNAAGLPMGTFTSEVF